MSKIVLLLSFVLGAAVPAFAQLSAGNAKLQAANSCPAIKEDLVEIKRNIEFDNKSEAVRILDRLIEEVSAPVPETFTYMGLVYHHDPAFRCNPRQERDAIRIAERGAEDTCYNKGLATCRLVSSTIRTNGYLGWLNGVYYGYGCLAEAVVEGVN